MAKYADRKWKDEFYVLAYRLAREGLTEERIAKHLGVTYAVLRRWKDCRPAFAKALEDGKTKDKSEREAQEELLYNRLSPEARDLWDRIRGAEEREGEDLEVARDKRRVRRILDGEVSSIGYHVKKQLFIHAMMACAFSETKAREMLGLSSHTTWKWKQDPHFIELLKEVHLAKKDLVESALMDLIKEREPAAVIFASKTLNRDRGYNDKLEIAHTVTEGHSVESLGLSLEEQKMLLEKIRAVETKALPAPGQDVLEGEFVVKLQTGGENVGV